MDPTMDSEWPTVIIPAYNEAPRIGNVLTVLREVNDLTAILVVDDGSTDGTADVVHRYMALDPRLGLIRQWPNQGKAAAMIAGAEGAPSDLLVFLDADLIGLTPAHVTALVDPVVAGQCDATVGLFRKGRLYTDLSHILTPATSGQRCLRWSDFWEVAHGLWEAGYGVEMVLHHYPRRAGLRLHHVIWRGVTHVTKEKKHGFWSGVCGRVRTDVQIARWYVRVYTKRYAGTPRGG